MFDTVDIKYPCYRRLRRYLSMLRRYSTLFIYGVTSKFLKTYAETTSNMDKYRRSRGPGLYPQLKEQT